MLTVNKSYHRLSAILFSDIVGYTSMMGENEDHTMDLLERNKKIHLKAFQNFNCSFYKQIGDAYLAIFDSVLDAAYAGSFIQNACYEYKIPLRIGIHQGEVVFKDKDVFGDDVNIASRIEGSAESGKIYVSETVKKNLDNKSGINASFVKECKLKNVKEAVKLYTLEIDPALKPGVLNTDKKRAVLEWAKRNWVIIAGIIFSFTLISLFTIQYGDIKGLLTSDKNPTLLLSEKSIAVLPLQNFSNDSSLNYIGDGFSDHIIINLSRIPDFRVIARSSSFQFKNSDKTIRDISGELDVQNILDGSFQINEDRIHLNLNLIHGPSGEVLYARSYEGLLNELFDLQDKVAEHITSLFVGSFLKFRLLEKSEKEISLNAFRFYEKGQSLLKENYVSRNTLDESRSQFRLASNMEPDWSAPYLAMAESYLMELHYGYTTFGKARDSLEFYIDKAGTINPKQGILLSLKGDMAFWSFDFKSARQLYQKAIELNPNYPNSHYYLGVIYTNTKYCDEGMMKIEKAISLDPLNERFHTMKPLFLLKCGRTEEAMDLCLSMLEREPDQNTTLFILGMMYTHQKEYDKALNTLLQRSVGHNSNWLLAYNYAKTGQGEKARKIFDYIQALPEDRSPPPAMMAILYLGMEDYDQALTYMEKSIETNDLWFTWLDYSWSDPVRDDPRFNALMEMFNLSIE